MMDTAASGGIGTTALFLMLLLGVYHGINPGMGWLFAVALGMQERSSRAVGRSLVPIALGHGLSIGAVVLAAALIGEFVPWAYIKIGVALILLGFGLYCLVRQRHPAWGGMRVGFRDLTFWSFLMASAHGAGFMVLPVLLGSSSGAHAVTAEHVAHGTHALADPASSLVATLIHTAGYLAATGLIAWVVYEKLGLALLRKAWVNLDWIWATALIVTACLTLWI